MRGGTRERLAGLIEGSGNVFRDFGDPLTDLKQAKAVLAVRIIAALDDRGLSIRKAAEATGFTAADFSRVRNADLGHFTLDRPMKMLAALDRRVRVTVRIEERNDGVSDRAERIVLSERDSARVLDLLENPHEPTPALRGALPSEPEARTAGAPARHLPIFALEPAGPAVYNADCLMKKSDRVLPDMQLGLP